MENTQKLSMKDFVSFCKKKGFIYQSCEIYGGLSGIYDYGNLGTLLKNKWCNEWRKYFLRLNDNFVEIDSSIIMHENVFKASGHLENFFDPIILIEGEEKTYRADHLIEENLKIRAEELSNDEMLEKIISNKLLGDIDYSKIKIENLNMMFPVEMGPKKGIKAYLRPETAQSPYVNFKNQFEIQRKKLPMGLGMIGRVYRNEISPRNLVLRTRELEQAELQIFFNPNKINEHENFDEIKDYELKILLLKNRKENKIEFIKVKNLLEYGLPKFYLYYMVKVQQFFLEIMKINFENFRLLELNEKEKAFYNKYHFDVEIKMNNPNSWVEVGGIHYRTDHDLKGHQKISKVKMEVIDEETKERFIPHVLELSIGLGRNLYSLLDQNLINDTKRENLVLNLPKKLSPYSVGIFPLMNKPNLINLSKQIYNDLIENDISSFYDRSGSIGKRYARGDEVGISYCLTIDYESIEEGENKDTITIRDRTSTIQKRIKIENIGSIIKDLISNKINFEDL